MNAIWDAPSNNETMVKQPLASADIRVLSRTGLVSNNTTANKTEQAPYNFYKGTGAIKQEKAVIELHTKEKTQAKFTEVNIKKVLLQQSINNMPLPGTALTKREVEIIRMAGKEFNSGEIAARLDINVRTVETHRKRIMAKTNSKNFIGVVIFALKNNYISIEDFS